LAQIAVISDIHGNLEALEQVLKAIDEAGVDRIFCLGDVVGYGPDPGPCVERVAERCVKAVAGNHEYAVLGRINTDYFNPLARQATHWTRDVLSEAQKEQIGAYPLTHVEGPCTFVHGTLDAPDLFDYIQTSYEAHLSLECLETRVCFIGHSHVPIVFLQREGAIEFTTDPIVDLRPCEKSIVNVGSVGQPRDGNPDACFVLYDLETEQAEVRRVPYDLATTQSKIIAAGLPEFLAERLATGR